jgi:hypothetical protein
MPTPIRLFLPLVLACLAGCPVWEPLASCADFDACGTTIATGSSSESMLPTTSASDGIQTVTGASGDEGSTPPGTESGVETGDSTGQPVEMPTIIDHLFTPNPIDANGPIAVTVTVEHAAGVRMETGLGHIVELTPQPQPGVFIGEIPVLTGLVNGDHAALLTPLAGWGRRRDRGGALPDRLADTRHREALGDRRPDRPGSGRRPRHVAIRRACRAGKPLTQG